MGNDKKHNFNKTNDMEYLIYEKENEELFLETHTSTGAYTTTEVETQAETFTSEQNAKDVIDILDGGNNFWGTRPTRPH